jgi:hypothetical protein
MPSSADHACRLLAETLKHLCDDSGNLYEVAFFCGQVSALISLPAPVLFNEMQAAFLQSIEHTSYAGEAVPDRLELYMADVHAGLKAGAAYPLRTVRAAATIESLNPLCVEWHRFPRWLEMRFKRIFGNKTHPLDGFSSVTADIPGADQIGGIFDHWGRCGYLFISEPYDYHNSDDETLKAFCAKVRASFRLAPVPYHHPKTQRIEIFAKVKS